MPPLSRRHAAPRSARPASPPAARSPAASDRAGTPRSQVAEGEPPAPPATPLAAFRACDLRSADLTSAGPKQPPTRLADTPLDRDEGGRAGTHRCERRPQPQPAGVRTRRLVGLQVDAQPDRAGGSPLADALRRARPEAAAAVAAIPRTFAPDRSADAILPLVTGSYDQDVVALGIAEMLPEADVRGDLLSSPPP